MDVLMPQLGETVAEGTVNSWFKSVGDKVAVGDKLFEIGTDKVAMDVEATEAGVLAEIRVAAGQTVPVGTPLAVIADKVGASSVPPVPKAEPPKPAAPAPAPQKSLPAVAAAPTPPPPPLNGSRPALDVFFEVRTPQGNFGPAKGALDLRVTPLARRLIAQNNLDAASIADSVKARGGWRIGKDDVLKAMMQAPRPATASHSAAAAMPALVRQPGDRVVPLNRMRKMAADHLTHAWRTIPHAAQGVEVDFSRVSRARDSAKEAFRARTGVGLTFLPFIARALCLAIRDFPAVNARLDGDDLVLRGDIHLGIAIDLDFQGLVVPVVRHADGLTVAGLAQAIDRLAKKARGNALTASDLEDGTYSVTNNGGYGAVFTTPIINAPQVAILSTDAIKRRPIVVTDDDGERLAIRPVGMLTQSFDHRAFDGAYAVSFLAKVKDILETRDWAGDLE